MAGRTSRLAPTVTVGLACPETTIREAVGLDAIEAPRQESEQRKKEAGDASAARDQTRVTNKAAFRF